MTSIDSLDRLELRDAFREAMASVCTPVSVVTSLTPDGLPHGTTVSAFTSLSMEPPMVLVSLDKRSELLLRLRSSSRFGLNILGSSQSALAIQFAGKGVDKFSGVDWSVDSDVPRLNGGGAFVACEITQILEGGDHEIVLGTVVRADSLAAEPLTYHARKFGTHAALSSIGA